jgi:hypothetical protein
MRTETAIALSGAFREAAELLLYSLSASNQRQYRHTFRCWQDCALGDLSPAEFEQQARL